jgi:hypothetical protein
VGDWTQPLPKNPTAMTTPARAARLHMP